MKNALATLLAVIMLTGCTSLGSALKTAGGAAGGAVLGTLVGGAPVGTVAGASLGAGVTTFAIEPKPTYKPEDIETGAQAATVIAGDLFEYGLYALIAFLIITNIITPYFAGKVQRQRPSNKEVKLEQLVDKLMEVKK